MLLLAAIALIAIGPKQLPEVARMIGRFLNDLRNVRDEFTRTIVEARDSANAQLMEQQQQLDQQLNPELYQQQNPAAEAELNQQANQQAADEQNQMAFDLNAEPTATTTENTTENTTDSAATTTPSTDRKDS